VTIIDLSHTIEAGMVTYPGLPAPLICDFLSREASREKYAPGYEFHIGTIEMVGNTGTYLDTPFHRFHDGEDLAAVEVSRMADLDGVVVRVPGETAIGVDAVSGIDVRGRAVLVYTGWDVHWRTEAYMTGNPYLTTELAGHLAAEGAALVGIDSLNIDSTATGERPVHTVLLGAGIPIVEHMTGLEQLPAHGFRFTAAPPKIVGLGTFPVRAYAVI
jgi:arylformamidase